MSNEVQLKLKKHIMKIKPHIVLNEAHHRQLHHKTKSDMHAVFFNHRFLLIGIAIVAVMIALGMIFYFRGIAFRFTSP